MKIDDIKFSSKYIYDSLNTYKLEDISDGMLKTYLIHATMIANELAQELNKRQYQ